MTSANPLRTKYIVLKVHGFETPVVFSSLLDHRMVANRLAFAGELLSAGFVQVTRDPFDYYRVRAFGESVSLGVTSRPDTDSHLLEELLLGKEQPE